MAGKSLRGTKSLANLKEAFAGESQANRRYLYFARVADIEGFPDMAGLFKELPEGGRRSGHGRADRQDREEPQVRGRRGDVRVHADVPRHGQDRA